MIGRRGLDTDFWAGKPISGRHRNLNTDAGSQVREWCE